MAEPSNLGQASDQAFERLAEPYRRELKAHCYRMMGSLSEAEDLVQETYLRAWRSLNTFDGTSMRAWLYRIATNACLNALESRKIAQRYLPDQLGGPTPLLVDSVPATEIPWLEPYPDSNLEAIDDKAPNPAVRYASHEAVQLAFVAIIQQLPPRQRAALLLCDVLGWTAAEVATLLGGSVASINSALQRGRETLAKRYPDGRPPLATRPEAAQQKLLGRYLQAWEAHDPDSFAALLKEDATFTMPPWMQWYIGRVAIRDFFAMVWKHCGGLRLLPVEANSQPGFAVYERSAADNLFHSHSIHVLTLDGDRVAGFTAFIPPTGPDLFPAFGLSTTLSGTKDDQGPGAHHPA